MIKLSPYLHYKKIKKLYYPDMRNQVIHNDVLLFRDGVFGFERMIETHNECPYQATLPHAPQPVRKVARHRLKLQ